ncbi:MAG: asparagine synthase (glutamine-hydrolyzing) [Ruminiclostridium sp.]|nr:asparagine synthase (glutamine-hydrolyzing) [Ruminiclostridium sp.]
MCGIAGWIDYNELLNPEERIIKMTDTMIPRGPDSGGTYIDEVCALGHRRLAVIDVAGGVQPMEKSDYVIVYNGELYNTEEIRRELKALGHSFRSMSDTEVLLTAFIEWGESCLEKLNGIYAFAIWDKKEKQLFIARDRMGVKPFFYYEYNGGIIFASEIKALLTHPKIPHIIDREGIAQITLLGPARKGGSGVIKGIKELVPSECGFFNRYGLKKRTYWSLRACPHPETPEETEEHIAFLIKDAIKRQLVSDVPLCTFLSGGLDSSIISAIAAKQYKEQGKTLTTYSVDYADNDKNFVASAFQPDMDAPWIREMSEYIGSEHRDIVLDTSDIVDALYPSTLARDLPGMADVDSSLLLFCREIKKDYTVALSGECADEIFGGYPWYHNENILYQSGFPWAKSTEDRAMLLKNGILGDIKPADYLTYCTESTLKNTDFLDTDSKKDRRMREMFMLNIYWFMQTLLDRKDRMSMATGLEVRVPFCDHRIAKYAYNIPWELKSIGGREKGLIRRAMNGILPHDVLWRKKSPYPKTHNPEYLKAVINKLREILRDKNCRITEIFDRKQLLELCDNPAIFKNNWYGQLMTAPQTFAYIIQTEYWLQAYDIAPVIS